MRVNPRLTLLCGLAAMLPLAGCYKLQARMELREGNSYYTNENYKQALAQFQKGLSMDPSLTFAWRSVGLSAFALVSPGDESEENRLYAQTAIDAFRKYLYAYPDDVKVQDFLLTTFIQANRHDEALNFLKELKKKKPTDPKLDSAITTVLIKADRLDEAMAWVEGHPTPERAETFYTIGVSAWAKAFNDYTIDATQRAAVTDLGLRAIERAMAFKRDYSEAMVYYGLLFREKEKLELDPVKKLEWFAKGEEWRNRALELRQQAEEKEKASQPEAAASAPGA